MNTYANTKPVQCYSALNSMKRRYYPDFGKIRLLKEINVGIRLPSIANTQRTEQYIYYNKGKRQQEKENKYNTIIY